MKNKGFSFVLRIVLIFLLTSGHSLFSQGAQIDGSDYRARRDKLCSLISDGVAIIVSPPSLGAVPPNPDSDFYYFTGVGIPDAKLILVPEKIAKKGSSPEYWKTTLYLPPQDPRRGVWSDIQLFPGKEAEKATGIENTTDLNTFYAAVSRLSNITDVVYLQDGARVTSGQELPPELQFAENIKKILPGVRIKNLSPILGEMRWVKSPKEIAIMRQACDITADTFKEVARVTQPGLYEYEIEAAASYVFKKTGCLRTTFAVIGSGPNSVILHHFKNDRLMKDGELLLIDIGTFYKECSTDLSRTIPVSGKFEPEQRKIYNIVLEAENKAISMIRPGVTLSELHLAALEVIEKAGYGQYAIQPSLFFNHTLNGGSEVKPSSVGLSFPYRLNDKPLVAGSMLVVEPGIYIPEKNLGIRIEDDVLVTKNGYEILTKNAPREVEDIEKLMAEQTVVFIANR